MQRQKRYFMVKTKPSLFHEFQQEDFWMQKSGGKCAKYVYSWNIVSQTLRSKILLVMSILFDPDPLAWVTSLLWKTWNTFTQFGWKSDLLITFLCKCFQSVLLPAKYLSNWGCGSFHWVPCALTQGIIHLPNIQLLNSTHAKYYRATDTVVEEVQSKDLAEHSLGYLYITISSNIFCFTF